MDTTSASNSSPTAVTPSNPQRLTRSSGRSTNMLTPPTSSRKGKAPLTKNGSGSTGVSTSTGLLTPMGTTTAGSMSGTESDVEMLSNASDHEGASTSIPGQRSKTSAAQSVLEDDGDSVIPTRSSRSRGKVAVVVDLGDSMDSEDEIPLKKASTRSKKGQGSKKKGSSVKLGGRPFLSGIKSSGNKRTPSKSVSTKSRGKQSPPKKGRMLTPSTDDDSGSEYADDHSAFEDFSDFEGDNDELESDFEPSRPSTRSTPKNTEIKFESLSDLSDDDISDDTEGEMMKAAIAASLNDLADSPEAGPSRPRKSRNKDADKRARAAERRNGIDSKEDIIDVDDTEDLEESLFEPKGQKLKDGPSKKDMAMKEMRKQRREAAAAAKKAGEPARQLQNAEAKRLGRKLTQGEKNACSLMVHHEELRDVWGDLEAKIEIIKPVPMEPPASLKVHLLPFQKESLHWMKEQEKGVWAGGMLADEMGMGKTIQTIALLLSEPRLKPSLVVAPVVALMQWKHEIEANAEGFEVCIWHGTGRMKAEALKKFDVVLVSYGTLEAAFRKQQRGFKRGDVLIKEKSPLHTFQWQRIILDEAHNIKERTTNSAKAAFALDAKYKWCLSGTPLQNRVGELYSLIRFLGGDPFAYYYCKHCPCKSLHWQFSNKKNCDDCGHSPMQHLCFWNNEILTPIQKYAMSGPGKTAFKKLKILLDRMMLRRTKLERADDLGLPPRTIVVRRDYFSPEEKELYLSLFSETRRQFATYIAEGTVLNNYSNIFSLITRMRQMACHPDLVLRSKTSTYVEHSGEEIVCRICNDIAEDAIVSKCRHIFDRECIRQYLESQTSPRPECPVCHLEISIDLEAEAIDAEDEHKTKRQGILGRLDLDKWRSSTKLEALVEELSDLRERDCTIKSIVFSQFVSFLDLAAFRLERAGFTLCRLEGSMTPQARDRCIQYFMKNPQCTVFLISLKAGGVALNLTEASHVVVCDSWWNPAVEYQAMDRVHRIGQGRPIQVTKLVVADSIEDKIVALQHKKLQMTEAALARDPENALGKLTPEDLQFLFKM